MAVASAQVGAASVAISFAVSLLKKLSVTTPNSMADSVPEDARADRDSNANESAAPAASIPDDPSDNHSVATAASIPDDPSGNHSVATAASIPDGPSDYDDSMIDGDPALAESDVPCALDSIQHVVHEHVAELLDEVADETPPATFKMTEVTDVAQVEPGPADESCTEESLALALSAFQSFQRLPPASMQWATIDYARRKSIEFLVAENYDAAEQMDQVASDLIAAYSGDQHSSHSQARTREIETHIVQIQHQRRSAHASLSARIRQLKGEKQSKVAQLAGAHEREKTEFAKECESREFLAKFAKPSPQLLQLRMTQKFLALAKDFEGAKGAKARADELQVAESIVASKRAMDSVTLLYRTLLEKQHRAILAVMENTKRKIANVQAEMKRRDDAFTKLLRQLEGKLREARTRRLPGPQLPKLVVPSAANKRMTAFRRTVELPQLKIKIDMGAVLTKVCN
jgi:hypothetical protein